MSVEEIAESYVDESNEEVSTWELVGTIVLDFIPGVGTVKGIIEGITGEDLITGQELTTFERATGWIPIAGKVGRGIKNIGKLSRVGSKIRRGTKVLREYRPVIGMVPEGSEHIGDAEDAYKGLKKSHLDDFDADDALDAADERAFAKKNKKKKDNPSTGAAKGQFDFMDDNYLKNLGYDSHKIKQDVLGKKAIGAHFDIYLDKNTQELFVFRKGGIGEGMPTGIIIKK